MIRRFGAPKQRDRKYTLRPGAYGILVRDGEVLLTHQGGKFDEYQLPGGGIDPNESSLSALYREVMEETGWSISRPKRLGAFRRFTFMPEYEIWAEKLCTIYTAQPVRDTNCKVEAHHTPVWATPREAHRLLKNEGDRHFLASHFHFFL